MTAEVQTTCPYCGVGCGLLVRPDQTIVGDPAHPSNRGRLCSKGAALAATLSDATRLTEPLLYGRPAGWDRTLQVVADQFKATIAEHGPDSVAFYVSGQCLTEDYYVANKLMKGFIGSANIDTNSRLCMASSVAGHVRAFGEDIVPGIYEDWDEADLVVLVGSNAAWCHPVLHQRLQATRTARGTKVVVLDPRRTATAEMADLHLPLAPGSDVALFNGLLTYLDRVGKIDRGWVARYTTGLDATLQVAAADVASVAADCDLDPVLLDRFFQMFAQTERVMTVYSQGVNQSSSGTNKVNAIINCHLATGRIGKPGAGPFSVTGQPNAMGGREVGGLANQLAAHMDFEDPQDRAALQTFWQSPALPVKPGLKAVELFDAVLDGRIKALWIVATNPAVSLPRSDRVRAAMAACPFVVVSDCWATDTTALAHVVLPASAWGEKDGTVTNSERRISRQRPFRQPPGQARPDWWQFAVVAKQMGWETAFAWQTPAQIFREHAALSGYRNHGRRVFDISALADLDEASFAAMQPVRWPVPAGATTQAARLFGCGGFPTADGKAWFVTTRKNVPPDAGTGRLLLNTGRIRDQWHTMTRTGLAPSLISHTSEPRLAIHPADAARRGIGQGTLTKVATVQGQMMLRAELSETQRIGEVFIPMHWTDAFASAGPVGRVVSARLDPLSGQPELKATPATVAEVMVHFHGLLLRRAGGNLSEVRQADICHWVRVPVAKGQMYRLAGLRPMPCGGELTRFAAALLDMAGDADWLEVSDHRRGVLRVAAVVDGVLEGCLFLAAEQNALPDETSIVPLLGAEVADAARGHILAAHSRHAALTQGPAVCACLGVGREAVRRAIVSHDLHSVTQIGQLVGAGTKCGSCIPELKELLRDVRMPAE